MPRTTAPAPTTTFLPSTVPGRMTTPVPIQLPLPIRTGMSLGHWACTTCSGSLYPWFWSVMYT
ncbi:MAG: hypothetical protein ABSC41_09105 [Acidimicrobiales bacterium]